MPIFKFSFDVQASQQAVREFHRDTSALKKLAPPLTFVQLHFIEPMAEGSISEFTLWIGLLPIRWKAIHQDVSDSGFTDIQVEGPADRWVHQHTFTAIDDQRTRVDEHIEYEHQSGLWGLVTRFLFARPNLWFMFAYRRWVTQSSLRTK